MRYVLTGPPCSGKSSVFESLKQVVAPNTIQFYEEVARNAMKYFKEHEPDKLPWNDRYFFQNYIETVQLQNFIAGEGQHAVYDRCIVDEIAYRKHFSIEVPQTLRDKVAKYRVDKVFYPPIWEEIYIKDTERTEELDEAKKIDEKLREAYIESGYELIELPKTSIIERREFIIVNI